MGQVISFPTKQQQRRAPVRLAAALPVLCFVAYVLGLFVAIPMLAMFAIAFTVTAQPLAVLACVAGAAAVAWLTSLVYKRL